jgi:hypothetical protein
MNGLIIFKTKVEGLNDVTNTPVTEDIFSTEYIVKTAVRRLRVLIGKRPNSPNPDVLTALAVTLEIPGGIDGTGVDVITLARLDNPVDVTIHAFYAYVATLRTKWQSENDEEILFKKTFP